MSEQSTPAGWYPDTDGSEGQRYFDGSKWTEDRTPVPAHEHLTFAAAVRTGGGHKRTVFVLIAAVIVGAVAVLVIANIHFGGASGGTVGARPSSAPATSPASVLEPAGPSVAASSPAAPRAGVGQQVRDGAFAFVVNGVENAAVVADMNDSSVTTSPQGVFVIVKMTVTNVGDQTQSFTTSLQRLKAGGNTFDASQDADGYLGAGTQDLDPGNQIDVAVAFDVPVGATPESIELHDSPSSTGVEVFF